MLACKHCSTPNSLDSTFCKKCGTAVPADEKREATVQLDRLVEEGLAALAAGRSAEALAIADAAVSTDPTHLGALQLKSAVHERRGEIADALESAERIVELNPDSELDRIKRNGLRTSLLNASTPIQPDRRVAFAAAAAAMVLVACAGVLVARRTPAATPSTVASTLPTNGSVVDPSVAAPPTQANDVAVNPAAVGGTPIGGASNTVTPVPPVGERTNDVALPRSPTGDTLPFPEGQGASGGQIGLTPITPPGPPAQKDTVTKPPVPRNGGGDPEPPTLKPQVTEPVEDPGEISISVSRGAPRVGGSRSIPETRTNGSAAYASVGQQRFQLGDYAGAATNLEKAVAGGGDAVELNLRLAQAYSRLGRNSDAASAYEKSRAAADAALASGKGNKERLQAQRDTADAGLKTVRGG